MSDYIPLKSLKWAVDFDWTLENPYLLYVWWKNHILLWLSTSVVDDCMFHSWVWIIRLQQLLIDWSEGSNSDCTSSNWNVKVWKIAQYRFCPPRLTEHYLLIRSCQTHQNHWSYGMVFVTTSPFENEQVSKHNSGPGFKVTVRQCSVIVTGFFQDKIFQPYNDHH